jgi:hypothetical protein
MSLFIYTLSNCKVCTQRQRLHNAIKAQLQDIGVNVEGIMFGNVNGQTYLPRDEHNNLCFKETDASKYAAPVYILEDGDMIAKVKNVAEFANLTPDVLASDAKCNKVAEMYADYIMQILETV